MTAGRTRHRIVVGGGAMGLAAAWQLARRGSDVLLLERFHFGHTRGASHGETRNLNNAYEESHYLDLYDEAFALWRDLEHDAGERLLTLCGLVTHGEAGAVARAHRALAARDAATEMIGAEEAARRWPGMRFEGDALVNRDAGRVHAATALDVLAAEARRHGAELRAGHRVVGIDPGAERVTVTAETPDGELVRFDAEGIVVAAGAWSSPLLDGIVDLPGLTVTEEHPAHFAVREGFSAAPGAWPSFNHFHLSGADGHRGNVYGMHTPGEGIKVGFHLTGDEVDPDRRRFRASDAARTALRDYVAHWLPALDPLTAAEISCTYTSTASERFVLDRSGRVTVGAGFSGQGFKFVPAIGRVLADASLDVSPPPAAFRLGAH